MEKSYWGVDSASPISEQILETLPRKPHFWVRYINYTPGICNALEHSELTLALNNGIRVGLVDSGIAQADLQYDMGFIKPCIARIKKAIYTLRIANKICVYLDVEAGTTPNLNAMNNYCNQCKAIGVVPGIYYNSTLLMHNRAANVFLQHGGELWSCEPEYNDWGGQIVPFQNTEPAKGVNMRQYQINQNNGAVDYNACNQRAYDLMVH